MTFTIQAVEVEEVTGRISVSLSKPIAMAAPDTVIVKLRLPEIPGRSRVALEARAKRAAKKALQDAILSL